VKLPRDYPGPEKVTTLCAQLRILGVRVPNLKMVPYYEVHEIHQRAYWGQFVTYMVENAGGEIEASS
jgi:hypothetical protein